MASKQDKGLGLWTQGQLRVVETSPFREALASESGIDGRWLGAFGLRELRLGLGKPGALAKPSRTNKLF